MADKHSFTKPVSQLTEDEVKRRFIPFLKDFYKNRYQSDPAAIKVELDNVSEEGWVADGKLTFRKEDDSPFICTYEATSLDKIEEVKYRLNSPYFVWDSIAFGTVAAAVLYFLFYQSRLPWLIGLKGSGNLGFVLGVFIIGFFTWYFSMQNWRKYRYIFAIQQFKQYFADEQWIALAEDVFPAPQDPYYRELRNQCVYNGIGLALVPFAGNVRKINDPSRLGIYGKDKQMAHWVTRADWYKKISDNVGAMAAKRPKTPDSLTVLWNKIYRPLHYLTIDPFKKYVLGGLSKPFGQSRSMYNRFMGGQRVQKWVTVLALAFLTPFFWKVASYRSENIADLKELQNWKGGQNPEDVRGYLIDGEAIPYGGVPTGVPKQYPISNKQEDEGPTINLSGDDDDGPTIYMSGDEDEKPDPKPVSPKVTTPSKPVVSKDCELLNRSGYLIQESSYSKKELAIDRANILKRQGFDAHFSPQSCLPKGLNSGYIVWLAPIQTDKERAEITAVNFNHKLQLIGLSKGKLLVRQLR